jgi:hypothetical protein
MIPHAMASLTADGDELARRRRSHGGLCR